MLKEPTHIQAHLVFAIVPTRMIALQIDKNRSK